MINIPPYVHDIFESVIAGYFIKSAFDSAVGALYKPTKPTGFYAWLYAFLRSEQSAVDGLLDARFHLAQPSGSVTLPASLTVTDASKEGK